MLGASKTIEDTKLSQPNTAPTPKREKRVIHTPKVWNVKAKRYLYAKDYGYTVWRFTV